MTYGHEDIDYKQEGNPSSGFIYNAAENVFWRRIRNLMGSQLEAMYRSRESLNCWSATSLINEFDAWQSQFPEELWRLDIERKYLRTYQGGTIRFLNEMMNGRKKYQRRQFERDQEAYIGTKYIGTNITADQIMFRCNTPQSGVVVEPDYTLRIVPYSDMYLTVRYGNSSNPQQIRAKAGQEYEITTTLTEMDDTAILIYCASRIQALNDLSACYIHDNDFSKASKLRTLVIGNTTEGYENSFLTTLNMGNNTLLETLDVRNCPNLTGSVNLTACANLLNFYAEGTSISAVSFATNGKLQKAHLPETISTLSFRNINYLTDLVVASYANLETFICEYSNIDALSILQTAVNTLQTIRILGIDWTLPDTVLLNKCIAMNSSLLSGDVYISGAIRNQELLNYTHYWADLDVTYDPRNLVTQYLVTYYNDDETTILFTWYVDRGSYPPNPVTEGWISTPVHESDAQYDYTFSGWDTLDSAILAATSIKAVYSTTVREYTVTWYSRAGLPLETQTAEYGECVDYSGDIPTRTDEESSYIYNVFLQWDKSTGFITGDTDVYAVWDRKERPIAGTEASDMSPAELYGVCQSGMASSYFEDKDFFEFTMGSDFTFNNVQENTIVTDRYFDGTQYLDTNFTLFDEDSPSFTMAIDFEFLNTNESGATLVSCFDESGNEGFRLRYSSNPTIQWGDRSVNVGNADTRGIVVLRHAKGSSHLFVYTFNLNADTYNDAITVTELIRTRDTSGSMKLALGAVRFSDGGHDYYGKGWIHWCKVWFDDLGDTIARKLASFPHQKQRMEFAGADRYRLAGQTSTKTNSSWIANNPLALLHRMNPTATNVGGWDESEMRTFLNTFVWNGLPYWLQSIIKTVKINASAGNQSSEIVTSEDRLYLPANRELGGWTSQPYSDEGTAISFFTSDKSRVKIPGFIIPEDAEYYTGNTDPTAYTGSSVKEGDIWINTGNSSIGYIYVSAETKAKHTRMGFWRLNDGNLIAANDGGLWVRASFWWERSPYASYSAYFMYVLFYGYPYGYYGAANYAYGVVVGFSI